MVGWAYSSRACASQPAVRATAKIASPAPLIMPVTSASTATANSMFGSGSRRRRASASIASATASRIGERFAKLASAVGMPVETHCHNDLGLAVANSVAGALGDLAAGQDAWINTCVNGIGERSGNADLLSCILAVRHGFGVADRAEIADPIDLSWARRFGLWAAYAFGPNSA